MSQEVIATLVGRGSTSIGGHPDVVAWQRDRIVYIEQKALVDRVKPSQVAWLASAIASGLITAGDYAIVRTAIV